MKILVTGATGFLGTALCAHLRAQGHELTAVNSKNCNLTISEALHAFTAIKFERIYHLAAWTQAGDFCLTHPGEQWIINQKINTNMLAWWQQAQPQAKLVCMGTSCSYAPDLPLSEENYLAGTPESSLYTYAMTKRMLLVGLQALQKQYGLRYLYLVPSTLFGPGYHTDGRQMHFIFDLIRKIINGQRHAAPVVLWGDGYQKRELVYLDDFIRIMLQLVEVCENDIVNIGAGEEYAIRDFARMICDHVGYPSASVQYDTSRYVGARAKFLRTEKLWQLLPGNQMTPLAVALAETIDWLSANLS